VQGRVIAGELSRHTAPATIALPPHERRGQVMFSVPATAPGATIHDGIG